MEVGENVVIAGDEISRSIEPEAAAAVRRLLEPVIRSRGLELVLVELRRERGEHVLRLFIGPGADRADALPPTGTGEAGLGQGAQGGGQGGVTLADCQAVSKEVSALLDVADPIPHRYVLEVSSPGIERPLVKPSDFVRFAGQVVRIRATHLLDGRQNFKGKLEGLQEDDVVIAEHDGVRRIPYAEIKRAHLVYEF